MSKYIYGAVIRPSEDGGYWAEVPDLPGCFTQGEDYMGTIESVSDSIETHLASLIAYGMPIPKADRVSSDDGDIVYIYADTDNVDLGVPTVSATEAARMLGVTKGRVSQLITSGRLIAQRSAGGTQVAISSIEAFGASSRKAGRPRKTGSIA